MAGFLFSHSTAATKKEHLFTSYTENKDYLLTVRIFLNSVLIFPTSFDSAKVSDLSGSTGILQIKINNIINYSIDPMVSKMTPPCNVMCIVNLTTKHYN